MSGLKSYFGKKFHYTALLLFFAVALSAIISLSKSVETQSLEHQNSLTPAIDLITQEIMKPLYIAETVARASPLKRRMNEKVIQEEKILAKLAQLSSEFDLDFFVASETSRTQYNSDGSSLRLSEDKVEWYFREKQSPRKMVGALGNRSNVSIYFDIKVFNQKGEFVGFIGVSKRLEKFMSLFKDFKKEFGYDYIFVDHHDNVLLSSDTSLMPDGQNITGLDQLPWFNKWSTSEQSNSSFSNQLVNLEGDDILIAEASLKALDWKLYLINPLQARQTETTSKFLFRTLNIIFLIGFLAVIGRTLILYLLQEFALKHQKDPLTCLPNRSHLSWRFKKIKKARQSASAIILDIDNFKQFNDSHGHAVGDIVLKQVSELLQSQLRSEDVVGRWGGEEFVILLPTIESNVVFEVAERTRHAIEEHLCVIDDKKLKITASFGVASSDSAAKLEDIVILADDALYHAKRNGRNRISIYEQGKEQSIDLCLAHVDNS